MNLQGYLLGFTLLLFPPAHANDKVIMNDNLVISVAKGEFYWVKKYLRLGANINARHSENGLTALVTAAGKPDIEMTKFLVDQNADLTIKSGPLGSDALSQALIADSEIIVDLLLNKGAPLQKTDAGLTPLMFAGNTKHLSIVKKLIAAGGEVNDTQPDGWSPLMHAVAKKNFGVVKLLVENGADISNRNSDGDTAIDIAKSLGEIEIVDFLMNSSSVYSNSSRK